MGILGSPNYESCDNEWIYYFNIAGNLYPLKADDSDRGF